MWRLLAEEHFELDLDALLSVTQPTDAPTGLQSPASVDEASCRALLSSMSGYLDEFDEVREQLAAQHDRDVGPYPGPEAVAEEQAAELAEMIDIPLT